MKFQEKTNKQTVFGEKKNPTGENPLNQLQPSAAIVWELPSEQQENLS